MRDTHGTPWGHTWGTTGTCRGHAEDTLPPLPHLLPSLCDSGGEGGTGDTPRDPRVGGPAVYGAMGGLSQLPW